MEFPDLTEVECPLLKTSASLRDAYNRVAEQFRLVDEHFGEVLDRKMSTRRKGEERTPVELLNEVRRRLSRRHYQVGFLGTTGAGKSTTLNGVLGNPPDPPGEPGGSRATTSTVMRLHAIPEGEHTMLLRYMTGPQYEAKREALAVKVGYNEHMKEQPILNVLPSIRDDLRNGRISEILPGDVDYLEQMVRAYLTPEGRRFVDHGGADIPVEYAMRGRYLNYSDQADPYNRLLRETVVGFRTALIPAELEMVDLPGLGASTSADTLVTNDFLGDLDGALVFFRGNQLSDDDAEGLLVRLRSCFGDLAGRVWVIVTNIDGLLKPQLCGNRQGSSLFSGLQHIHNQFHVPLDQFYLVSNGFRGLDSDQIAGLLKQKMDGDGPVPPPFRDEPTLRASFEALLEEGGIPRLRRLVSEDLARRVEERLRAAAQAELRALSDHIITASRTESRRLGQGADARAHTATVRRRLQEAILKLEAEHGGFEAEAGRLRGSLLARFERECLSAEKMEKLRDRSLLDLAREFKGHTDELEALLQEELESVTLSSLYGQVQADLDSPPQVPVLSYPDGQAAAWRDFTQRDRHAEAPWRKRVPVFRSDTLFGPPDGGESVGSLDGFGYREVMHEKIEAVGQQTVYSVRRQIRLRLKSIVDELDRVIHTTPRRPGATPTQFDSVLKRLADLHPDSHL